MDFANIAVIVQVVIVFGLIVFVHELGHFLAAKWAGVGVERFSLGFGPKILGRRVGETEYMISAVPLGGYVKMVGEEIGEDVDPNLQRLSFSHKPVGRRFLIVFAGPSSNLFWAFVIFTVTFLSFGVNLPLDAPKIGGVQEGWPAQKAGLEAGDEVLSVGGAPVATWEEMAKLIQQAQGKETQLTVKKGKTGQIVNLTVTPELRDDPASSEGAKKYAIGITPAVQVKTVSAGEAAVLGAEQTWLWTKLIVGSLIKLFRGEVSAKELGGPILIAQVAGQQAKLGLDYLLRFAAIINVNLAIFNLLPIPVLDGGHLLFFSIEAILGRPLSMRSREMAWRVGFLVIVTLIVLVFYNDIARLVG
ncbi:MAG TPA: RIP metalloprotease RseP [Methylomirabilota bacterium]|nr:RIP metalloprotease RseP [Methylomirabilota bacterium]